MNADFRDIGADEVEPERVTWAVDGRIPRHGITICVGFRDTTKTTWAAWLAGRVSRGDAMCGGEPQAVLFSSQEDDVAQHLRPRVEAAGATFSLVRFPEADEKPLTFPRDCERLARYINERQIAVAIFDPLEAHVPGFLNSERCRDALTPLHRISGHYKCAMVFIHHFRKTGGKDVFEAMGGSGALGNLARAVFVYGHEPSTGMRRDRTRHDFTLEGDEEARIFACHKLTGARRPPSLLFKLHSVDTEKVEDVAAVSLLGECDYSSTEVLLEAMALRSEAGVESEIEQAMAFLVYFLDDGPRPTKDVNAAAADAGVSKRTLERARAKLSVEACPPGEARDGFPPPGERGNGWWLRLPPQLLGDLRPEDFEA